MRVCLGEIAFARSGDKGDTANVGLIAFDPKMYPLLVREVTADRVRAHFGGICHGEVERFELPNLHALNFLLHQSLGGGGTVSLMLDAQGKTFATALLRMEIEVPNELLDRDRNDDRNGDNDGDGPGGEGPRREGPGSDGPGGDGRDQATG